MITTQIQLEAGKALFISQMIENNLAGLCQMFNIETDVSPHEDQSVFGDRKQRTASFQKLKKALAEIGINGDHYFLAEIHKHNSRRNWLAHRIFIEQLDTVEQTREFQLTSLIELNQRAYKLSNVLLAVCNHVDTTTHGDSIVPEGHIVEHLIAPFEEEARAIFQKMCDFKPSSNAP